jgi:hypothetical protein
MRKQGSSGWAVVDDWVARAKVANAFRGRRKAAMECAKPTNGGPKTVTPKRRIISDVSESTNVDSDPERK